MMTVEYLYDVLGWCYLGAIAGAAVGVLARPAVKRARRRR